MSAEMQGAEPYWWTKAVTRESLARDILLKFIEGECRDNAERVRRGDDQNFPDCIVVPGLAVQMADALLAELAKAKEGA